MPNPASTFTRSDQPVFNALPARVFELLLSACFLQLEALVLTGEDHVNSWITGMDALPSAWSTLTSLKSLTLRNHQLLDT
jgi:hypothetical protein